MADSIDVSIVADDAPTDTDAGNNISLQAGRGGTTSGPGGSIFANAGAATNGKGGTVTLEAAQSEETGYGGDMNLYAGPGGSTSGGGGEVVINAGSARGGDSNGGNVTLRPGNKSGSGIAGQPILNNLPTSDPLIENAVWWDNGVLTRSSGSP